MKHLFKYKWYLKDGYPSENIKKNNLNVFGTFICGGGSTMGYKLAGYNHLGGVEIDKKVSEVYKLNHNPKYLYTMDIRDFNQLEDLPSELFNLDILDGSPPCSTFSMAGSREKAWNKEKVFREGQSKQRLDDLVFIYVDTILKLKPKVAILENVKGIIQGNAKLYSKQIVDKLTNNGYNVQVFCLNAASMGVPQRRERVFFIASQKELKFPKLKLEFNEESVPYGDLNTKLGKPIISTAVMTLWQNCKQGDYLSSVDRNGNYFTSIKMSKAAVSPSVVAAAGSKMYNHDKPNELSADDLCKIGTYPLDYNFKDIEPKYLIGMSVPPVMTAQIANQINLQWFKQ